MKILVVDDSAVMRKLIIRALGGEVRPDIEVLEAAEGMQALAIVARHGSSIDLILCDMNMPNVDGLAFLMSLRASPDVRHIPFIIVTADTSDERAARALREGAAGVIGKPFRPEVIAALVRKKRLHGRRATSGALGVDTVTGMIQTMTRSDSPFARAGRHAGPAL
jgi:two-component system chemotaxis response regulator CheY